MDCEKVQDQLWSWDPASPLPAEIAEHVATCACCARTKDGLRSLTQLDATNEAKFNQAIGHVHNRVMERIMGQQGKKIFVAVDSPNRRAWAGWIAAAASIIIAAAVFLSHQQKSGDEHASTKIVPPRAPALAAADENKVSAPAIQPTAIVAPAIINTEPPTLAQKFAACKSPSEALRLLQMEFRTTKSAGRGFDLLIALSRELMKRWPDSPEFAGAQHLIADCYRESGEMELSKKAILAYADSLGQQFDGDGQGRNDVVAKAILREGDRLFAAKDYLAAIAYCDEIIARFPESEFAGSARLMMGKYYRTMRMPSEALAQYQAVAEKFPATGLANDAYPSIASCYTQLGRGDMALATWDAFAAQSNSDSVKACALYNKATEYASQGTKYYPDAINCLKQLTAKYPDATYSKVAQKTLVVWKKAILAPK